MRLLIQHLVNAANTLREYAKQCGIASHGDNIGLAREALATHFLRGHMSDSVNYLTGEIFDQRDARSGQIDLILHPHGAPRLNLFGTVNMVFADWVLAAIEVKSNLTTAAFGQPSHLKSALDACARIKQMTLSSKSRAVTTAGQGIGIDHIPYIIFAFDGPTVDTLRNKLFEYQTQHGLSLDMMPDLITVLSRDYYLMKNNGWLINRVPDERVLYTHNSQPEAVLLGLYAYVTKLIEAFHMLPRTTPFSTYLHELTQTT